MNGMDEVDFERDDWEHMPSREELLWVAPKIHGELFAEAESFADERKQEEEEILKAYCDTAR